MSRSVRLFMLHWAPYVHTKGLLGNLDDAKVCLETDRGLQHVHETVHWV